MGVGPYIGIPSGDEWAFNASLLEFVEGQLRLKDLRTLNERFAAALNVAKWGTLATSPGTVTINPNGIPVSHITMSKPTGAAIAAIFLKEVFDESNPFRLTMVIRNQELTQALVNFLLSGYSADPTAADIGNFQILMTQNTSAVGELRYRDSASTTHYWTGSIWQTGIANFSIPDYAWKSVTFINNGTSWKVRFLNEDGSLQSETTPITWANTKALGGGESAYMVFGMNQGIGGIGNASYSSIERWLTELAITYSTTSPTATSPWFAIDQNTLDAVTAILLQLILDGTATIKFQYALNGGAFNGSFLTPSQLLAALVGQSITDHDDSMRLMMQFNSNGTDQARALLPQTRVEVSGITGTCDYPIESDVRLGVDYNSAALTGTAAIPGANDVRQGVAVDATTGNYVPADEDRHALGDSYGSLGTEFTGTKALTPFQLPVDVILEDSEIIIFEGCE